MRTTLGFVAFALLAIWAVEYFGYHAGRGIHLVLLCAALLFAGSLVLTRILRNQVQSSNK